MFVLLSIIELQATPEGQISLPVWLFWTLIGLIGLFIILLMVRDKKLRTGIKNLFVGAKMRMRRSRIQKKIKTEVKNKEKVLNELGKKAWEIGLESEAAASINKEITELEEQKKEFLKEAESVGGEIDGLQKNISAFIEEQNQKIQAQEETKKPHVERLAQLQDSLKKGQADLSHVDKELKSAEKEKQSSEKEVAKIEADDKLSDEMKESKIQELKAKVFDMEKKKEELDAKRPSLEEQRAESQKQIDKEQNIVKELDQKMKSLRDEEREKQKEVEKEIKKWQKKKDELQGKIENLDKAKAPLLFTLGKTLDEKREDHADLNPLYTQIDSINQLIDELEAKLAELT